jgi:HK97 family phage prohead protease
MTVTTLSHTELLATPLVVPVPLTLAEADEETGERRREFEALAVPYEVEVDRSSWMLGTTKLRIAAGACTFRADAKLFYGHDWQENGTPVGRIVSVDPTDAGPRILGRLWRTLKADEVLALMEPDEDGVAVLDKVSIGFYITAYAVEDADGDNPVLVVTAADVFETSVVPFPQFDGAAIESVLHRKEGTTPMTQSTATPPAPATFSAEDGQKLSEAVDTLSTNVDTLGAKLATFSASSIPDTPAELFGNSYGEFVKAMLAKDPDAQKFAADFQLAYEGGKVDDTTYRNTWLGDNLQLIEKARRTWNLFDSGVLPAEGMKLEYGKVASNTVNVEEQELEGDAIVMGNVKIGTDTADVFTFAGGSELSFQQAKRSNVNVIDLHWRALAIAYGKATETKCRELVNGAAAQVSTTALAALDDFDGWIDFLIDGSMHLDDKGLEAEFLRLSVDQFKRLAKIRQGVDGPYLLNSETGSINLLEQTGNVSGLKIALTSGTNMVELGNSFAVKTFESGGAPVRLGPDEDILTLTEAIGVYGFGAIALQDPKALYRAATV